MYSWLRLWLWCASFGLVFGNLLEVAKSKYIVGLETSPISSARPCLNFYDEYWVCFSETRHVSNITAESNGATIVELNKPVSVSGSCQYDCPWHLHYLTNTNRTGRQVYRYDEAQLPGSPVYVLDTWVDIDHPEFEGRVSRGPVFNQGSSHYHGTHVTGLIGSKQYGVNKQARLISVQVLDDNGQGSWGTIIAGLHWISKQAAAQLGVINISLAGDASDVIDRSIKIMIKRGWKVVMAAGNESKDACQVSPARVVGGLTVGASDSADSLASFSNYGACVDIVAPGVNLLSTYPHGLQALMSGTSMAAPLASGVWSLHPDWPVEQLIGNALHEAIVGPLPQRTANRLLFSHVCAQCL